MRKINTIVVHVTDSPDDKDIGVKEIRQWHLDRGWSDIGYHYVIRRNGKVEKGRDVNTPGAHVKGHNKNSLGVVWVGREQMTIEQIGSLVSLVFKLMCEYNIPSSRVLGHFELDSSKTCPNMAIEELRDILSKMVIL